MSQMFDALGNQQQQTSLVQQLKSNPAEFLKSRGFNVPAGVDMSNPQAIINGLVQTGQIGNGRIQRIMRMPKR